MLEREAREGRPIRYDEAVPVAIPGAHHSDRRPGEQLYTLPYYGAALERHVAFGTGDPKHSEEKRLGRLANPTVHIGLNQVRLVVNELIERYGRPHEIVVELARPLKQSQEARHRAEKEQAENQKKNDDRKALLRSVNAPVNGRNLMKLRLWEEQGSGVNRRCPYTGETIGLELLLSEKVDIDHILPFSRSLDDSAANKVVCLTAANREKANMTPYERWHDKEERWSRILGCVEDLPPNKRWRFAENAMNRWDEEGGFLARQITDTQYLARLAREYLRHVCHPDRVRVSPGRLTALLRRRWGIDSILRDHNREGGDPPMDATFAKNRDDHRHHALDAAVIGCIDQGMVQKVAQAASRAEDIGLDRLMDDLDDPWDGFRDELAARVRGLTISHKPEHGTGGRLHEDTAYGPTTEKEREKGFNLVYRKPLDGLTEKEIARIRDPDLRRAMQERVAFHRNGPDRLDVMQAVAKAAEDLAATAPWTGIRRARLLAKEADPIWLKGPDGEPYKGLIAGDVHHIDIVALPDGRWTGRAKIRQQGAVLEARGAPSGAFEALARKVRSGDPDNIEAQAARRYWPLLFGDDFRRDSDAGRVNGLLNYGYAILRSTVARGVMGAGLHPTLGLFHRKRANPLCLVDDLMEPFRPFVDLAVLRLAEAGHDEVTPEAKRLLALVPSLDVPTAEGTTPLSTVVIRAATSLAQAYESGEATLDLPARDGSKAWAPMPLEWPAPPKVTQPA